MEYWCGHTYLSVPLELVLHDIVKFIKKFPSEVILIDFREDTRSENGFGQKETSRVVSLKDPME